MNPFVESVTAYVTNPQAWMAPGPIAQFIGILLVGFSLLQSLPNNWAGGKLFTRKIAWITYSITALYVLVVFVIPFVGWTVGIAMIIVLTLVIAAINRREAWKTE